MFGRSKNEIVGLIHEARELLKEFRSMSQQMKTAIGNLNAAVASWEDTKKKVYDFIVAAQALATQAADDSADAAAVQVAADAIKNDGAALLNEIAPNPGTQPAA